MKDRTFGEKFHFHLNMGASESFPNRFFRIIRETYQCYSGRLPLDYLRWFYFYHHFIFIDPL